MIEDNIPQKVFFLIIIFLICTSLLQPLIFADILKGKTSNSWDNKSDSLEFEQLLQFLLEKWNEIGSHDFTFVKDQFSERELAVLNEFRSRVREEFLNQIHGRNSDPERANRFYYLYYNLIEESDLLEIDRLLGFYSVLNYIYSAQEGIERPELAKRKLIEVFRECRELLEAREELFSEQSSNQNIKVANSVLGKRYRFGFAEFEVDHLLVIQNIIDKSIDIFLKNPELQYFLKDDFLRIVHYTALIISTFSDSPTLFQADVKAIDPGVLKNIFHRIEWLEKSIRNDFLPGIEIFSQHRAIYEFLLSPEDVDFERIPFTEILVRPKNGVCLSCGLGTDFFANSLPRYIDFFKVNDTEFTVWNRDNRFYVDYSSSFEKLNDLVRAGLDYDSGRLRSFQQPEIIFSHYLFLSNSLFFLYDRYKSAEIPYSKIGFLFPGSLDFYLKGANFVDKHLRAINLVDNNENGSHDLDIQYESITFRVKQHLTNMTSRISVQDRIDATVFFLNRSTIEHRNNSELFSILAKYFYASGNQRCALDFLSRTGGLTSFADLVRFSEEYPRFRNVSGELICNR